MSICCAWVVASNERKLGSGTTMHTASEDEGRSEIIHIIRACWNDMSLNPSCCKDRSFTQSYRLFLRKLACARKVVSDIFTHLWTFTFAWEKSDTFSSLQYSDSVEFKWHCDKVQGTAGKESAFRYESVEGPKYFLVRKGFGQSTFEDTYIPLSTSSCTNMRRNSCQGEHDRICD